MKLNDDFNEINKNRTYAFAAFLSIATIVVVVVFVLIANSSKIKKPKDIVSAISKDFQISESLENGEEKITVGELTVSDLDFYDLYPETKNEEEVETEGEANETPAEPEEVIDASNDGKHTLVTYLDGTTEWVAISPYLRKNDYDYSNLFNQGGKLKYFEDNVLVSGFGLDISEKQDYVDFNKVKKAGADFVLLRAGVRGYQSGQISEDSYFKDNIKRANDAGLDIGVYFVSSAVSEEEAIEEADFVIGLIGEYKLNYPVGFVLEYQKNDSSRIDSLSRNELTMITRAFLKTVKEAGFKPIVYGKKEWLIKRIDLSKLIGDFDFWFSDTGAELPDYPYKFTIWQYDNQGTIDGVSGPVNFNISFTDYELK